MKHEKLKKIYNLDVFGKRQISYIEKRQAKIDASLISCLTAPDTRLSDLHFESSSLANSGDEPVKRCDYQTLPEAQRTQAIDSKT